MVGVLVGWVAVIRGVAAVATVVVVISFIESSVCEEGLCLLRMLFLVCCNRRLKFVDKGSKVIRWVRDCISACWYSLARSDDFVVEEVYGLQGRSKAML